MVLMLVVLLLALMVRQRQVAFAESPPPKVAHGKTTILVMEGQTFACVTQPFATPFDGDDVMVYLSPSRSANSPPMLESSATWVEHVHRKNFTACVKTSARIFGLRILDIQWLAFTSIPPTAIAGVTSVSLWTTGTKCIDITYTRILPGIPVVFVSAYHQRPRDDNNAASIWTEDVTPEDFKVCLREVKNFDGVHRYFKVHWLVMDTLPVEWTQAKVKGRLNFPNTVPPPAHFQYSYCQEFNFPKKFYSPPTVIATASHRNNKYSSRNVWPKDNAITYWIEFVTKLSYQVCVKDLQPYNGHHDAIFVDYLILGDLHPCLEIECGNYAKCTAHTASDVRCECDTTCPLYKEQICDQYGQTYSNPCTYQQKICNSGGDSYIVKNGSCEGFNFKHGRVPLTLNTADYKCSRVSFGYTFKPNATIYVYLTVDYHNSTIPTPHDTPTVWAEGITTTSFSACVLKAGRNDVVPADGGLTFVNFMAYQGSPPGAITGDERFDDWWEGTSCRQVDIPKDRFGSKPYVLVTSKHTIKGLKHDAATIWVEDLSVNSFRVCLRELQSFDCMHHGIVVNWLAFSVLPTGVNGERHQVILANTGQLSSGDSAYCKNLAFTGSYVTMPTILLSAVHQGEEGELVPDYNSISAWVEKMSLSSCTICTRQHHRKTGGYDALSLSVALLGVV